METVRRPAEGREVELVRAAREAAGRARCAYSHFPVGAAIMLDDGQIVSGFNCESPAYTCGICAERMAIYTAVNHYDLHPHDAILFAVWGQTTDPISPCGQCRQVMSDILGPETPVILADCNDNVLRTTVRELLPLGFKDEDLV